MIHPKQMCCYCLKKTSMKTSQNISYNDTIIKNIAVQQPLGRKDTDEYDVIENDTPEAPPMEEECAQGSRKKSKVQALEDLNQTDTERRSLRAKLRDIQRNIKGLEYSDAIENPVSGAFEKFRKENNELFEEVRCDHEGALDGESLDLFESRAKKQVSKLIQLPPYDTGHLVTKSREKGTPFGDEFYWRILGRETGVCFKHPPFYAFF